MMHLKKRMTAYLLLAVFLENIILIMISCIVFSGDPVRLTEEEAVSVLNETLQTDGLHYLVRGESEYMGEAAYGIRAYYDGGDHITTKGYYLVLKDSHEVYAFNMLGEGYIRIT